MNVLFTLAEPTVLVLSVLCTSVTAYLMTLHDKTRDLRFLIATFCCWTAHFVLAVCREAIYPPSAWFSVAQISIGMAGLVMLIGFAYTFRGTSRPREFRWVLTFTSIAAVACSATMVMQLAADRPVIWGVASGTGVVLFLCAESVFIRRWLTAGDPVEARSFRSFALVFVTSMAAVAVYFVRDLGALPVESASITSSILYLATAVLFTLAYVNHAPHPTTFRVKIVGASLFSVLAVVILMWTVIGPSWHDSGVIWAHDQGLDGSGIRSGDSNYLAETARTGDGLRFQQAVIACNYCIIGSALFVVTFFPAFFRVSLVEPLNTLLRAVDRVDAGERDLQVPVLFQDEIGHLTTRFNRMIGSLRAAEYELTHYAESLELKVRDRTAELHRINEENLQLLLNILPAGIAERLKGGERVIADFCPEATILFADIVGFTDLSSHTSASEVVEMLGGLISEFDRLVQEHGVEKIKTIGDAYMAVAGLPTPRADHAQAAMRLALDMLAVTAEWKTRGKTPLQLRIGINSGPVIAGVIGTHKFAYDLWGDAVNTASRMESHGIPGCIQVTESTFALLKDRYTFKPRGPIDVKGKGSMMTYIAGADQPGPAREPYPVSSAT